MLLLPQPHILIEGTFGYQESGDAQVFHLENAGRTKITALWSHSDGTFHYYTGSVVDAGDRDGEREWIKAWVQAGPRPLIRVDHANRTIAILTYNKPKN